MKQAEVDIGTYDLGPYGYGISNEHDRTRGPVVVATPRPTTNTRTWSTASTASITHLDPEHFPYLTRQIARCDPSPATSMSESSGSADTCTKAPEAEGGNAGLPTPATSTSSSASTLPKPPNPIYSAYGIQRPKPSRKDIARTAVPLEQPDGDGRWLFNGSPLIQWEAAQGPVPCRERPRWLLRTLVFVAIGAVLLVSGFGLVYGLTRKSRSAEIKEHYKHIPERNRQLMRGFGA